MKFTFKEHTFYALCLLKYCTSVVPKKRDFFKKNTTLRTIGKKYLYFLTNIRLKINLITNIYKLRKIPAVFLFIYACITILVDRIITRICFLTLLSSLFKINVMDKRKFLKINEIIKRSFQIN